MIPADLPRTTGEWMLGLMPFVLFAFLALCMIIADLRDDGHPWRGIVWAAGAIMGAALGRAAFRLGQMFMPRPRKSRRSRHELEQRIAELERDLEVGS